ncbi:ankyrin repeat domain-containing protein [Aquimarina sp. M1]
MDISIDELSEFIYYRKNEDFFDNIESLKIDIQEFNSRNYSLLHVAAKVEDSEAIIVKLVELGLDVNIKDPDGNTPLMVAANYNCPNNVRVLLKNKADSSVYNNDLNSALHLSCAGKHIQPTEVLIENGADVNIDNGNKKPPLVNAVKGEGSMEIINLLLNNGADINYGSGNGTPLMFAISYKNLVLVKYLLEKGAKIKGLTNRAGEDTLEFAKRVGDKEILSYLIEWVKKE